MSEKIVLKNARLSYEHIFKPDAIADGNKLKYSATWIIPKNDPQVKTIKEAINKALDEKFPGKRKNGAWPSSMHNPLKDGDELADERPEYAGAYILRSASKIRPKVFNRRKEPVTAEDELIYSGCYCNASLAAAGFDSTAKKGVTIYLNGVQFFKDGDRLAGYDATNDFDDLGEDEGGESYDDLV